MHRIAVILLSLMLIVAPVYGQATPPIPTPSASSLVRDVTEATQALGTVTVVILAVLAVLVLIVVFFVVAVWRLGTPLVNTVQRLMETVRSLMEARDRRDLEDDTRKQAQIAVLERYKALLEDIERKDEAEKSRKSAVRTINEHTDTVFEDAKKQLIQAAVDLDRATKAIENVVTKDHLTQTLKPILLELKVIADALRKTGDPAPEPVAETPAESPAPEHGTLSNEGNKTD